MRTNQKIKKRIYAVILSVLMIATMLPIAEAAPVSQVSYIGITSDVHGSAANVSTWLTNNGSSLKYMLFGGDTGDSWNSGTNSGTATVNSIKNAIASNFSGITPIFTMGNHDWMGGNEQSFQTGTGFSRTGVQNASSVSSDGYTIYTFGVSSQAASPCTFQQSDIDALGLALTSADPNEPFIILSHYPLHYGDGRTGVNTSKLIDLLNQYPNVFFFWGHNHHSDVNMGTIRVPGDLITPSDATSTTRQINFTYCNSGHMGNESGQTTDKYGTGVRMTITSDGSDTSVELAFQRMAGGASLASATVDLGNAGVTLASVAVTGITAPVANGTPDTDALVPAGTATAGTVTWTPQVNGHFLPGTVYTASVNLTATNRQFDQSTAVTINGSPVSDKTFNTDGTLTAQYVFPATGTGTGDSIYYRETNTIISGHEYVVVLGGVAMNTTARSGSSSISGSPVTYTGLGFTTPVINGNDLTFETDADAAASTWTFTSDGAGAWYISNGGQYVYAPQPRTMSLSASQTAWNYGDMGSKGIQLHAPLGSDDCNLCYGGTLSTVTVDFVYPSVNNSNTLSIFEKTTETPEEPGAGYELASSIVNGSTYIIVAKLGNDAYVLTNSVANTKYLTATPVTVLSDSLLDSGITDAMKWRFTTDGNGFDINNNSVYLNRKSSNDGGGIYTSITEGTAQYSDWIRGNSTPPFYLYTSGSGKESYLSVISTGGGICFSADKTSADSSREIYLYRIPDLPINSLSISDVTAPSAGETPDTSATVPTGSNYYADSVSWSPSGSTFGYDMVYTVSVTLAPSGGYEFSPGTAATVNGKTAASVTLNSNGTLNVTYSFPKTRPAPVNTYKEAASFVTGSAYVIVSRVDGNAYALTNSVANTNFLAATPVTVSGDTITSGITPANEASLIWTFTSAPTAGYCYVKNDGKNLTRTSGNENLKTNSAAGEAKTTHWKYLDHGLSITSSKIYYLYYNSDNDGYFANKATTNTSIYLYEIISTPTPWPPEILTASLPGGTVGMAYSQTLAATGDVPISWTIDSGNLPGGLTLNGSGGITGTPAESGTFNFTVKAINGAGTDTQALSITIQALPQPPVITTTSLPGGTVGTAYSQTLAATGDVPISWTIDSGNLPGGLSLNGSGGITGTPTATGTYTFTVKAENNTGSGTKALSIVINLAPVAPVITTTSLPGGTVGTAYSQTLAATGDAPISWTIDSGNLPGGLTLNGSGGISGTPAESGTFNFTVKAINGAGTDTQALSITIQALPQPPEINPVSLASGTVGEPYSQSLTATGDTPIAWSIDSGSLPDGLNLVGSDITGTPTATGTYTFTVKAENNTGSDTKALSIVINLAPVAPVITTASLPVGTVGTAYSQILAATGDAPISWTIDSGTLPDGLELDDNLIWGTPSETGTFTITIKATNTAGSDTQTFSIVINPAPAPVAPTIITTSFPAGMIGTAYSQTLAATGDAPITWTLESGSLPDGLTLSGIAITGTPSASGTLNFTVKATNGAGNDTQALSIAISNASTGNPPASSSGGGGGGGASAYFANVTGNGTATLPVTVDGNDATTKLGTKESGSIAGGKNIAIALPHIPVSNYIVDIPAGTLSTSDGKGTLTFSTEIGSITLPANMLADIAGAEKKTVKISIGQGDKSNLPDNVKTALGSRPLIQLSMMLDNKPYEWNNSNAPVTVSIPYKPTAEELSHPESIVIWYIDGSGNLVSVPNGHYDQATGTVIFETTHFSYFGVGYSKVGFNDVTTDAWYNKAVSFIAARGVATGMSEGYYSPYDKLTRGQFVVMLMKAYSIAPDSNSRDNFTDAGNTWYTGYLAEAKRLGISSGIGGNLFAPEKQITRQEMFTMLSNALKVIDKIPQSKTGKSLSSFSDADQISSWAKDAITLLVETGTVGGSGEKLSPTGTTTRAEMAQVLYNLLSE